MHADDFAVVRDDHHVGLFGDLQRGDHVTVAVRGLHVDHAFAATRRDSVFGERRALPVAFLGHGQHQRHQRVFDLLVFKFFEILRGDFVFLGDDLEVRLDRVHADDVVVFVQVHAVHAAGVAAHRTHFRFAEQNRLPFVAGQENHLLAVSELRADELVLAVQGDGDDARRARVGEFRQRGLLYRAALRGHEDELIRILEIARRDERGELLVFLEFNETRNGFAAGGRRRFRQFIDLQPVDAALRGEQQDVAVRRGDEQILDEIFFLRLRADAALAAARLVAVRVRGRPLDVARVAHGDQHLRVGDQVFELDLVDLIDNLRAPVVAVGFVYFAQLRDDDLPEFLVARQNFAQLGDQFTNGL